MARPPALTTEIGYVNPSATDPSTWLPGSVPDMWWWELTEQVPDLRWPMSLVTYSRMPREDARCWSLLSAIGLPIRRTAWRIDPNGAEDAVVKHISEDLGLPIKGDNGGDKPIPRQRDRFSWKAHLRDALSCLRYGHCVDYDTEILTQRGWLSGHDLREGDQVMTLNPDTGLGEWQPCETVHRWDGQHAVRRLEGRSHSSVTTLNHKWITRDYDSKKLRFRTTAELNTNDRIIRAAPTANLPREAKWSDAFVELVAWYWTEGQQHPSGGAVLWQSADVNAANCQRIRAALTTLFGPARSSLNSGKGAPIAGWRETQRVGGVSKRQIASWHISKAAATDLRAVAPDKIVDPGFIAELTASQLRLFVETSIDADGWRGRSGSAYLAQKNPAMLDAFEMACSLLGIPWTRSYTGRSANNPCTRIGTQIEVRPVANAQRTSRGKATSDTWGTVDGVWCPQVQNRTWLARRRGTVYFTGNSVFEQVYRYDERDGKFHLRKLAPRPQFTIRSFNVDRDGGLVSIVQDDMVNGQLSPGKVNLIDVSRLVVYRNEPEPGVWIGTSLLRPSYKHWLLKDELMRIEAAAARRNGIGVPVATTNEKDASSSTKLAEYEQIASRFRGGMSAGAALPYGAKLEILGVQGNLPDLRMAIEYHDKQIALAGLAHFLNLDRGGSYALASVQADVFVQSVQAIAEDIADITNQHVIEDLLDSNYSIDVGCPRLVCDEIGSRQDATASALALLVQAGLLDPDAALKAFIRQQLGAPALDPNYKPEPAAPATPPDPAPAPAASARKQTNSDLGKMTLTDQGVLF